MLYVQDPYPVTSSRGRWPEPIQSIIAPNHARLLALVLLAIGIRLLYIGIQSDTSHLGSTDAWGYHRLAFNLDLNRSFSLRRRAPFEPDSVRTPLYPLFLLLTRRLLGPHPRSAAIMQATLDGISTLLTYRLALLLAAALGSTAGRSAGRAAALLYALNPVQIRQTNELLAETLLSCLLLLGLCMLVQYSRIHHGTLAPNERRWGSKPARLAPAIGAVAALAALCKPNVQYLPLLWLPAMLVASRPAAADALPRTLESWPPRPGLGVRDTTRGPSADRLPQRKHRWRDAALVLVALGALLSPWMIRNRIVFGRPFLSTAFQGNVSRVSAPATLLTARDRYPIPWSAEWESAFGEIVAQAALHYRWDPPWESMNVQARDNADREVYLMARQVLAQHPGAWAISHLQGTLRYLEPQTYRALYAHWTGTSWPPDVLDDALIHALRALVRGDWEQAGRIVAQERWSRLTPLQRAIWWSQLGALLLTTALATRGAWALRRHPTLLLAILGTILYVLVLPGPIAYERFRAPVLGPILTLATLSFASPRRPCYNVRE